jgi:hypothetical protein
MWKGYDLKWENGPFVVLKIEKWICIVNEINGLKNTKDSSCLADIMREGKFGIWLQKKNSF